MITIVRLREYSPRQNHTMRSFTTSFGNLFREGQKGFRRVDSLQEVNELRQHPQFEIHQFESLDELELFLDGEAQKTYARQGVATKPPITPVSSKEKISRDFDDQKRAKIQDVLRGPQGTSGESFSSRHTAPSNLPVPTASRSEPEPAALAPEPKHSAPAKKPVRRKTKRK